MKRCAALLLAFVVTMPFAQSVKSSRIATTPKTLSAEQTSKFDFQFVNVSQVVNLIYGEVLRVPYVIDPDVLTDVRMVSFRYEGNKDDLRSFINTFFDTLGLAIRQRSGVDFITRKKVEEKAEIEKEIFVYRPKFRSVSYITGLISPLLKGSFTVNRTVHTSEPVKNDKPLTQGSAASLIDQPADALIYAGTAADVALLKKLLPEIDERVGEVMIRGVVYEVSASEKDGSAFSLALNLLGGKLNLSSGVANQMESFARFKSHTIDAVFSALATDNRFKVVSTPSLRVRSGENGRFMVGQDVRVPGAVSYPGNGQTPVQSVENLSSGVIFDLLPQVRDSVVDLKIAQQLSNFTVTETGISSFPTVIKREVKSSLSLVDGEVVVLGGLAETKESGGKNGASFLPSLFRNSVNESSKTEILLILQLTRV